MLFVALLMRNPGYNSIMKKHPNLPLISIITVSHNAADFIEQTIASVLSQTYPFIEYIVIDGASSDGTVDIIRRYESRLAYWHSKPDRGIAQAFNLGLEQAGGDWIVYLNADDFFVDTSVVSRMVPYLLQHTMLMSFMDRPRLFFRVRRSRLFPLAG